MSETATCKHERLEILAGITVCVSLPGDAVQHEPITMADLKLTCAECRTRFQFNGLPAGLSLYEPRVSIDGCELHIPVQPYDGTLARRATFEMPRDRTREQN